MREKTSVLYGPVMSWRLGRSIGLDLISTAGKVCTFDCVYCQLGKTVCTTQERKVFVTTDEAISQLKAFNCYDADYLTFSGVGEPSLAANIGDVIREAGKITSLPIAVLTNSSLLACEQVRTDLAAADYVIAKLDAADQDTFKSINRPVTGITLQNIVEGLLEFKKMYRGRLALQIMLVKAQPLQVKALAELAKRINPSEIQLNTPLRPCMVSPLERNEMDGMREFFAGMEVVCVYDRERVMPPVPVSLPETLKRRPVL